MPFFNKAQLFEKFLLHKVSFFNTQLFIDMNSNRLVVKKNIHTSYRVTNEIKKLPVAVYSFVLTMNGFTTKIERFNKFERNFIESFFFKKLKAKFKNKLKKFIGGTQGYEFFFDPFEGLHSLKVKINLITQEEVQELAQFLFEMKELCLENIGGRIYISHIILDKKESVMESLIPYSNYDDNMTFEELSESTSFPEFYTKDLFDLIHEPMRTENFS